MTDWTIHRWHGAPAALKAALAGLGWRAPEAPEASPLDPRVGGFLPPSGEEPRVLDDVAYAAVAAHAALPLPQGLEETGPELSAALIGSF